MTRAALTRWAHRLSLAAAAALLGWGVAPRLACAQRVPDYGPVIAELERIIPGDMEKQRVPGLAIALVDGQRTIWSRGFGFTDRPGGPPVTDETLFSLQSISKTYTATGVLLAVQKGWLRLDDPLRKFLTGFTVHSRYGSDEAAKITIRHLLSHHAGFNHEAPMGGNFDDRPVTFEQHIASISDGWLQFPVGQRYSYSNLGIDLAGWVLQLRSRRPFPSYMKEVLFGPLGMTSSTFDQAEAFRQPSVAKGHVEDRTVPDLAIVIIPSGGMYSTVKDMARFVSFQLAGGMAGGKRLLAKDLLDEMYTPQFRVPGQIGGYGLAVASQPRFGATVLQHGGGGYGFSTSQFWIPKYQIGAVVLTNQQAGLSGTAVDTALKMMIRAKYGSIPEDPPLRLTDRPVASVEPEALRRLAGSYKPRGSVVRFEVRDTALWVGAGASATALVAHGPSEFTSARARYRFDLGEDGAPRGVEVLTCCGLEYWPYSDGPNDPPGPNRPGWSSWVGAYKARIYGGEASLAVSVKNGYLYLDWNGGLKLSEDSLELYFTPDGESVTFGEGRVTVGNRPFVRVESR